jgi:hypothetical protein
MTQSFDLAPLSSTGNWSFIALLVGFIGLGIYIYYKALPQTSKVVIAAVLLPMVGAFSWMLYSVNDAKLILTTDSVTVDVPFYGFTLPIEDVNKLEIRKLAWQQGADLSLKPDLRVNGVGMPGFQLGWFRLSDQQKAFVAITETDTVVVIPTLRGYSILLSIAQPDALLGAIK